MKIHDGEVVARVIWPISLVALIGEILVAAIMWISPSINAGMHLDNFWSHFKMAERLQLLFPAVALGCLIACSVLTILRISNSDDVPKGTIWCLVVNFITMVLLFCTPAIQSA